MTKKPAADEDRRIDVTAAEFRALFQAVSNWRRWGEDDERGTLNELSADRIVAAANLVRTGETVTLGLPLNTKKSIDNPEPAVHRMTLLPDVDIGSGTLRFAKDYIGADYHNDSYTHIDALSHVALDDALYNGKPSAAVTSEGASTNTIEILKNGLVGRGVLLDVPRLRGVPWLEPGEHVFPEDLEAAGHEQGVAVGKGDILLVRTGHVHRLHKLGPWDTVHAKAGFHPTSTLFLAERRVAVLGSDGNSDTAPSTTEGISFPIHALTLNAMGLHLIDYLQFEDLLPVCERADRWDFLFVGVPLRIVGGTGSPVNPIAIF
jgi:kynurenine formamidase